MGLADLFRPKHKHSNANVRAAAVADLDRDNLDILVEIAKRDQEASIRKSAIDKLEDPEILASVAEAQDDAKVRDYAIGLAVKSWLADAVGSDDDEVASAGFRNVAAHGGDKGMAEIAISAKSSEVRALALERISDEKALVQVIRNVNRAEEWKSALSRVTDLDLLRNIAIDEKRKEVAMAALADLEDDAILAEIVGKAKNKSVRTKAKRMRSDLAKRNAPVSTVSDGEKRARAERSQLTREVEELAGGDEWLASRETVDAAVARFAELGPGRDAALAKRFEKAVARYNKNHGIYGAAAAEAARKAELAKLEEERAQEEAVAKTAPSESQVAETDVAERHVAEKRDDAPAEAAAEVAEAARQKAKREEEAKQRAADAEDAKLDNQDDLERLCEELEELASRTEMKGFDRALKTSEKARRKIGALPKAVAESLPERYDAARRAAVIRLGELREADDWKRWAAVPKMEALVARAKALLEQATGSAEASESPESEAAQPEHNAEEAAKPEAEAKPEATAAAEEGTDAAPAEEAPETPAPAAAESPKVAAAPKVKNLGEALKTLQKEWREVGPSPRDKGEELWKVFKETCDAIYEGVKAERDARNAEQRENLAKKEALCERAEALSSSTDWQATGDAFKELQAEWKAVGPVPRRKSDALWKRFRGACDAFFEARAPHLEEKFSEEAENLEAKQALVAEALAIAEKPCGTPEELEEQLSAVRDVQKRWRGVGRVSRRDFAALNDAYREACDKVYAKRSILEEAEREALAKAVSAIEETIGACADAGWDTDASEVAAKVVGAYHDYRDLDAKAPGYEELGAKLQGLIRSQLESEPAAYKGTALDPERSAAAREKLIAKAEEFAPDAPGHSEGKTPEEIAQELQDALAKRALGHTKLGGRSASEVVGELRQEWAEIGLVPGAAGTALTERFQEICERILAEEGE